MSFYLTGPSIPNRLFSLEILGCFEEQIFYKQGKNTITLFHLRILLATTILTLCEVMKLT